MVPHFDSKKLKGGASLDRTMRLPVGTSSVNRQCCIAHVILFKQSQRASRHRRCFASVAAAAKVPTPSCPPSADNHPCFRVHNTLAAGLMDYRKSWAWQHVLLSRRLAARRLQQQQQQQQQQDLDAATTSKNDNNNNHVDDDDLILLFEHHPVYTLGRGADENHLVFLQNEYNNNSEIPQQKQQQQHDNKVDPRRVALSRKNRGGARLTIDRQTHPEHEWLAMPDEVAVDHLAHHVASPVVRAPNGAPIYRVERGGQVTFHGPGQLVVYPLMDLKRPPFTADLHWFLRQVEDVIIETLHEYDVTGVRDDINTGVWVDRAKIAAVGVAASRWITTHGFALNVRPDLSYFDTSVILPCGIDERGVTSLEAVLRARGETQIPTVPQVANVVLQKMEEVFSVSGLVQDS